MLLSRTSVSHRAETEQLQENLINTASRKKAYNKKQVIVNVLKRDCTFYFYLFFKMLKLNMSHFVAALLGVFFFSSSKGGHDRKSLRTSLLLGFGSGIFGYILLVYWLNNLLKRCGFFSGIICVM